jgi:hypothetical protein
MLKNKKFTTNRMDSRSANFGKENLSDRILKKVLKKHAFLLGHTFYVNVSLTRIQDYPFPQLFVKTTVLDKQTLGLSKSEFYILQHDDNFFELRLDNIFSDERSRGRGLASLALYIGFIACSQIILGDHSVPGSATVVLTLTDASKHGAMKTSFYENLRLQPGTPHYIKNQKRYQVLNNENGLWNIHEISNSAPHAKFAAIRIQKFLNDKIPGAHFLVKVRSEQGPPNQ